MKHLPEQHQSIAPGRAVVAMLVGIVVIMGIIWIVVAAAPGG